jgi:hypothetical protein
MKRPPVQLTLEAAQVGMEQLLKQPVLARARS